MTPTDLLFNGPFSELSPGVYTDDAIFTEFAAQKFGGLYTVNRLTAEAWSHTFDGYLGGPDARVGVLFDSLGGLNRTGLVIEGYKKNQLDDRDWPALVPVNGSVAAVSGPTYGSPAGPVGGFRLTAAAAGDCYIQIPGLFGAIANQFIALSVAAWQPSTGPGQFFMGFVSDGVQTFTGTQGASWRWFTTTILAGAAPTDFRIGFTATGAGESLDFAFPQVELYEGTSPILEGARIAESLGIAMANIVQNGRLSFEWDLIPETDYSNSTATISLLYVDATNRVDLVWDPALIPGPSWRVQVTINGVVTSSEGIGWNRGVRLRLFLVSGNGPCKLAWKYDEAETVCRSASFAGTLPSWPTLNQALVMGLPDPLVRQLSSIVLNLRAYPNGGQPDWVGCACAS